MTKFNPRFDKIASVSENGLSTKDYEKRSG